MSQPLTDILGQRFGSLVAIECKGKSRYYLATMWLCQCDCGRTRITQRSSLLSGRTKTCGRKGCKGRNYGEMKIVSRARKPVELPLIKVRWSENVKTKGPRPATAVRFKLQKVFANDAYVRKHQGLLTMHSTAEPDHGKAHPFVDPDSALWIVGRK